MIGVISEKINFLHNYNLDGSNTCVFFDGYIPPVLMPDVCQFSVSGIFDFRGIAASTCIESTKTLLNSSTPSKKFYLVENAEWTNAEISYKDLMRIFFNKDLKIVALNEEIHEIISDFFREPDLLMESFDLRLLENV
jgi:hypothetical protein|tara:strand:+ start:246 stop:656 length:411 start_codon:yes stop_codon:yes gene_type:complete